MIGEWIAAFLHSVLNVTLYPCSFVYNPETFLRRFNTKFSRNIFQYAVFADNTIIPNVVWSVKRLTKQNSKKPLRYLEQSIRLVYSMLELFFSHGGKVFDTYAG